MATGHVTPLKLSRSSQRPPWAAIKSGYISCLSNLDPVTQTQRQNRGRLCFERIQHSSIYSVRVWGGNVKLVISNYLPLFLLLTRSAYLKAMSRGLMTQSFFPKTEIRKTEKQSPKRKSRAEKGKAEEICQILHKIIFTTSLISAILPPHWKRKYNQLFVI